MKIRLVVIVAKSFTLFSVIVLTHVGYSQAPGNVSSNLELWLKADKGVLNGVALATDGQAVNIWKDQSGARTNDATDVNLAPPTFRDNTADYINYNAVVDFDGTNDGLDFGNDYIFSSGIGTEDGMTWFAIVEPDVAPLTKVAQFVFDFGEYAPAGYGLQYGYSNFSIYTSTTFLGAFSGILGHSRLTQVTLNRIEIDFGNQQRLYWDGANTATYSAAISLPALSAVQINENPTHIDFFGPFTVGRQSKPNLITLNEGRRLDGSLAELVGFNKVLSVTEIKQAESYLAIKYGITLDNTGGGTNGDYLASDASTVIWDASLTSAYHNDIMGIARDDNSELVQKQSHTLDDNSRIYLNTLATSNTANSGVFSLDQSYALMGHNDQELCATAASNAEIPPLPFIFSRLEREWKVTRTNFSQDFSVDIKIAGCGAPGSVVASDLLLLVDTDGDFTDASVYVAGAGLSFSYSADVITVTGISSVHIPDNSTRYISIGSNRYSTPLPIELLFFEALPIDNRYVELKWETASETNNAYFVVERSKDGINWEVITEQIPGAGNSSVKQIYKTYDYTPFSGHNYYRLKQVDFDGQSTYSQLKTVSFDGLNFVSVYPNPATDYFYLKINAARHMLVEYSIYNLNGDLILNEHLYVEKGIQEYEICTEQYATGSYWLKVTGKNKIFQDQIQIKRE